MTDKNVIDKLKQLEKEAEELQLKNIDNSKNVSTADFEEMQTQIDNIISRVAEILIEFDKSPKKI